MAGLKERMDRSKRWLVAEALWKLQAVAFALRLYSLGAWAINRSADAREAAGFDWKRWAWPQY